MLEHTAVLTAAGSTFEGQTAYNHRVVGHILIAERDL